MSYLQDAGRGLFDLIDKTLATMTIVKRHAKVSWKKNSPIKLHIQVVRDTTYEASWMENISAFLRWRYAINVAHATRLDPLIRQYVFLLHSCPWFRHTIRLIHTWVLPRSFKVHDFANLPCSVSHGGPALIEPWKIYRLRKLIIMCTDSDSRVEIFSKITQFFILTFTFTDVVCTVSHIK